LTSTDSVLTTGFEVSVFGPGKGEALAVHLGGDDWLTVDSCRDQQNTVHPVLGYLEQEGVSAEQLCLVVATHAHDDHMAGISDIVRFATESKFVSSSAITTEEFFAVLAADEDIEAQIRQSVRSEYREVRAILKARGRDVNGLGPWKLAKEQVPLWERPASPGVPAARVLALSPSDEAVLRATELLAEGTSTADSRRRLSAGDPNENAIALWIEVGDQVALLGADLLNGPKGCGWQAVLATHKSARKASLYKVPHHGSPNADLDDVWDRLLIEDVVSILAPYRAGVTSRPSPEDVKRIVARSAGAYSAAQPKLPTPSKVVKRARMAIESIGTNVRDPDGRVGQVRARWDAPKSQWHIELFEPALRLK
jgi:hypothetical protein